MLLQLMGAFADVEGSIIPQPLPDHRAKIACQAKWFVRLAEQAPTGPAESAAQQKSLGARQHGGQTTVIPIPLKPTRAELNLDQIGF